ncbi:NADH-ubiquinone oxidoreductase subunit (Tim17/Tim22/Tim23 family protein) [Colletotrichum musicola]|uniref:NADH-ubiquinone oxidoreductase subunit (Tim17/Tim22/Tim23 family protein) n=3 Tax=Colletotrichum orchidearum species complex TaxID=2707337 RepID=A0A8H6KXI7_9PEZI|nr:NADH-ubiquinone oxidoreductase subunit (Tim17/Tim22/Tim23 family protein) [Colletotrichum sojae]KAF6827623.1 NADH-ubiquinone oxidoreductase subunit (Tim17/Tim22/Tim23 family protein) [Colletotrichum plurivorum]KAF6838988.1 NADH-ubiquinone oxidoreductase subunit (Tim17/Tim22/Tim23 family protein) [Colletotrichum musicola]
MAGDDDSYHAKDAIKAGISAAGALGGTGFFIAAVQNALQKKNVGAMSVFTRSGGIIAVMTIGGGAYGFTQAAMANLREKDDAWNTATAGFIAGSILGMTTKKMPVVLGLGAGFAAWQGVFALTGGRLRGWTDRLDEDEFDRKIAMRENRRRPIEETIANIGEGRGIRPPGYEERRRERLKEKYGVEINPVKATVE